MKCKYVREKILNAIASEEARLPRELTVHLASCAACASYYEAKRRLFLAMNAGLQEAMNRPAPPSLLPKLRQSLNEPVPAFSWPLAWVPTAALLMVAALTVVLWRRPAESPERPATSGRATVSSLTATELAAPRARKTMIPSTSVIGKATNHPAIPGGKAARPNAIRPEILVAGDELEGLVILRMTVHEDPEIGGALLRPVIVPPVVSRPIISEDVAPVEVARLEIPLLPDSSAE